MMMYSRYYLVLTLVSIIGLALPFDHESSVMAQRKIAKGSKKNPPLLFRQEITVELVAPQAMPVPELETAVTDAVLDILGGQKESNSDRHKLLALIRMSVETTRTTKTKCAKKHSVDVVACYDATVMISSKEDLVDCFPKLWRAFKDVHAIRNCVYVLNHWVHVYNYK